MKENKTVKISDIDWYDAVVKYAEGGYVISWHLRFEYGFTTKQINYQLDKLVKAGKLRKETNMYCSKYFII